MPHETDEKRCGWVTVAPSITGKQGRLLSSWAHIGIDGDPEEAPSRPFAVYPSSLGSIDIEASPLEIRERIIIIGAGIGGLALANYLSKEGIPFVLCERDLSADYRPQGFAFTLSWGFDSLAKCLTDDHLSLCIRSSVTYPEELVSSAAIIDGRDGSCIIQAEIEGKDALRVNRAVFRNKLFGHGDRLRTWYGKTFRSYRVLPEDGGVEVTFEDGSRLRGGLVVGADGASSRVRRQIYHNRPQDGVVRPLPITIYAATHRVSAAEWKALSRHSKTHAAILLKDCMLFYGLQRHHPDGTKDVYWQFSWRRTNVDLEESFEGLKLSTPSRSSTDTSGSSTFSATNYIPRPSQYAGRTPAYPRPPHYTDRERLLYVKHQAGFFPEPYASLVRNTPNDTECPEVWAKEWSEPSDRWPRSTRGAYITLIGDAAHPMSFARGIGANSALLDAANLGDLLTQWREGKLSIDEVLRIYEKEALPRSRAAVERSRESLFMLHRGRHGLGTLRNLGLAFARAGGPGMKRSMYRKVFEGL